MAPLATPVTTADVVKAHRDLTAYVFGNFHRKLTYEDARDAAAEALSEADRAVSRGCEIRDLHQWLRTAAWRNALDAIRRNVGEGQTPRERAVEFTADDHADRFIHRPDADFVDAVGDAADAQALREVWRKLSRDEQRALHLRYFDELPVSAVLEILGCSRHHYENLTKRALRKLRDALVTGEQDAACRAARALVVRGQDAPLSPALSTERDIHLESCLSCRAFARRSQGLIAAVPLPALGLADRLLARWHSIGASPADAAQAGETLAGATALAGAGAGAGAAAAGGVGALGTAGVAKTLAVVCSAGAVTAGVCLPALEPNRSPRESFSRAHREATTTRPSPSPSPSARAAAAPVPTPVASAAAPARRRAADNADAVTPGRGASKTTDRPVSPFLPESGAPPRFDRTRARTASREDAGATDATATTFRAPEPLTKRSPDVRGPSSAPSGSSNSAPVDRTAEPTSSPFSQEFTP